MIYCPVMWGFFHKPLEGSLNKPDAPWDRNICLHESPKFMVDKCKQIFQSHGAFGQYFMESKADSFHGSCQAYNC